VISTDKDAVNIANNPPLPEPPPQLETEGEIEVWVADICTSIIDNSRSNNNNDKTSFGKPTIQKFIFNNEI
jgi:hypothetical protein